MEVDVQLAVVSAVSAIGGVIVAELFRVIHKLIDNKKERFEKVEKKTEEFVVKKENVYIAAIGRLLQIRRGFDYTREMAFRDKELYESIQKDNLLFAEIAPKLRLYSSDKIFNMYSRLLSYAKYAYAPMSGPRLIENSKWAYDMQITVLSRLMQEDLGYRKYNAEPDLIVCPDCGVEHDMVATCPNCKMTYADLQKRANEILNQNSSEFNLSDNADEQ